MDPRTREQLIYEAHRKSTGVTYLLWFFFGFLGAHRFYAGKTGTAVAQLLLSLTVIGLIPMAFWWLIDAFLIPEMVRDQNLKTINLMGGGQRQYDPREQDPRLNAPEPEFASRSIDPRVEEIREMRRR